MGHGCEERPLACWRPRLPWRSRMPAIALDSPRRPPGSPNWPRHRGSDTLAELRKIKPIGLIVINEVAHVLFDAEKRPKGFFQLDTSRCEKSSITLTTNLPFSRWPRLGEATIVSTTIDRIVHHPEVIATRRNDYSYHGRVGVLNDPWTRDGTLLAVNHMAAGDHSRLQHRVSESAENANASDVLGNEFSSGGSRRDPS
ncbi:UNVERIFIED_CONTAM: IstB-like ATP binding protein [Williamsia faeni]